MEANATDPVNTSRAAFLGEDLAWSKNVLVVLYSVSTSFGIFGTVLVFCVLTRTPYYRHVGNSHAVYMVFLCVVDVVMIGLYSMVPLDLLIGRHPVVNHLHCSLNSYLVVVGFTSRFLFHAAIYVDRCLRFCKPTFYQKRLGWTANAQISSVLMTLCLLTYCTLLVHRENRYNRNLHICALKQKGSLALSSATIAVVVTSLLTMLSSSLLIWRRYKVRVRRQLQVLEMQTFNSHYRCQDRKSARDRTRQTLSRQRLIVSDSHLLRCLLVNVAVSSVLNTPLIILNFLARTRPVTADAYGLILWVSTLDIATNWILYGAVHRRFRQGYKKLLCCLCSKFK